jgi:anti-anti-sigma factor
MEVTVIKGAQTFVKVMGRMDTVAAPLFMEIIEKEAVDALNDVVVDCSELSYISSSGLRQFLSLHKMVVVNQRGKLVFRSFQSEIRKIIDMAGFQKILQIE